MPRVPTIRSFALGLALVGLAGCRAVGDRVADLLDRVRPESRAAAQDDTSAAGDEVAESVDDVGGPASPEPPPIAAAFAPSVGAPPPNELEVRDVEVEWIERGSWGHYGSHDLSKMLRVRATGKLRASMHGTGAPCPT